MKYKKKYLSKLYTFTIIILPIIYQYRIAGQSVLFLFSLFSVVISFITTHSIKKSNGFSIYFFYSLFSTIIITANLNLMSISLMLSNLFSMLLVLLSMYILAPIYFDIEQAYRIYTGIVYIVSFLLLLQFLFFMFLGVKTSLIIPGMILNYGGSFNSSEFVQQFLGYQNYRVSSVFIEPAMYAAYVLPWVFFSLFNIKEKYKKKNIIQVLIITSILCLAGSSYGILGVIIAWVLYAEIGIWKSGKKSFVLIIPILIIIACCIFKLDIIQTQISIKLGSLNNLDTATSTSLRLLRGWYCFTDLNIVNKIFGCGYGILSIFFDQYGISTIYDTKLIDNTFMNSFFKILCQSGIFGSFLYFFPIIRHVFKNEKVIPLFVCFVYTIFTTSTLDMPSYFLLILLLICSSNDKTCVSIQSLENINISK